MQHEAIFSAQTNIYQDLCKLQEALRDILFCQGRRFFARGKLMERRDSLGTEQWRETANILESLANLIYLTRMEADSPERVRAYMTMSEERMQAIARVLCHT